MGRALCESRYGAVRIETQRSKPRYVRLSVSFAAIIILASLARLPFANAQGSSRSNTPEYFYQPNLNNVEIAYQYDATGTNYYTISNTAGSRISDNSHKESSQNLTVGYGISDAWAFRASSAMTSTTYDTTPVDSALYSTQSSGISDLKLMLTNMTVIGGWNLHVGVGTALSPAKRKLPTTANEGNQQSGGTSIINYAGFSTMVGAENFTGFKASYITKTSRTVSNNTASPTDYMVTGGNIASFGAFWESGFSGFVGDVAAEYGFVDPELSSYVDGTTSTKTAYNIFGLTLGAQYQIVSSTNLRLQYAMLRSSETTSGSTVTSSFTESTISIRLRLEF